MILGLVQILINVSVNALIAVTAGSIAVFLARGSLWASFQRRMIGVVLAGLAPRIMTETRR